MALIDWMEALLEEDFFDKCSIHENRKNEKNIYCLDCCDSICPHCVNSHRSHKLLQIRRYVLQDVVRTEDINKLIDTSDVQAYTVNHAKVIFIKKRDTNSQPRGVRNKCTSCDRFLQEPFIHCSLSCKVDYIMERYGNLSQFLETCHTLHLSPEFYGGDDDDDDDNDGEGDDGDGNDGDGDGDNNSDIDNDSDDSSDDDSDSDSDSDDDNNRKDVPASTSNFSYRRRSRKGIPHRSPMF